MFNPQNCSICLETLMSGKEIGLLVPCGHVYHTECVNEMLKRQVFWNKNLICPNCNRPDVCFQKMFLDLTPCTKGVEGAGNTKSNCDDGKSDSDSSGTSTDIDNLNFQLVENEDDIMVCWASEAGHKKKKPTSSHDNKWKPKYKHAMKQISELKNRLKIGEESLKKEVSDKITLASTLNSEANDLREKIDNLIDTHRCQMKSLASEIESLKKTLQDRKEELEGLYDEMSRRKDMYVQELTEVRNNRNLDS